MTDDVLIDDNFPEDDFLSVADMVAPDFRWTPQRWEFVYHVSRSGNAYDAARQAGYVEKHAEYLIKQQPIRDAIQEEIARQLAACAETEESVIARWARWANANPCVLFNDDWTLKPLKDIPQEVRRCVKKIKITHNAHGRNTEVEFHDAHRANNDLATMMGLLGKGDSDTTPPEETAQQLQKALQAIKELNGVPVSVPPAAGSDEKGTGRLN